MHIMLLDACEAVGSPWRLLWLDSPIMCNLVILTVLVLHCYVYVHDLQWSSLQPMIEFKCANVLAQCSSLLLHITNLSIAWMVGLYFILLF